MQYIPFKNILRILLNKHNQSCLYFIVIFQVFIFLFGCYYLFIMDFYFFFC